MIYFFSKSLGSTFCSRHLLFKVQCKYDAIRQLSINLLLTMGGGCSAFKKPIPMIIADLCSTTADLIAASKKLAEAPEVRVKEVAGFVKSLSAFVDTICDLFESLGKGNNARELVKNLADLTIKCDKFEEGKPLEKNDILDVIVAALTLVKTSLKLTADFVSEFKQQLDLSVKALDEVIKALKEQLPKEKSKTQKFVDNVETIVS